MQRYLERTIAWRRHLHQHPEESFEEVQTAQYIVDELKGLKHARIERLTPTSVVLVFDTGRPGARIGLRADTDALPVQEDRPDLPFASKVPGKMHACGHDGHTAILMATCLYIDEHIDEFSGQIHAIFQHAEEILPGGAREMVATGYFDDFDFIYGQHLVSPVPTGVIDIKAGPATANTDAYNITIHGKGGHAAMPDLSIDPVVIGAQFVTALQSVVSRKFSPHDRVVISNTMFHAGTAQNIIPHTAKLTGSVRTMTPEHRERARAAIEALLKGLCEAHGATWDFEYEVGYDATFNDPEKTAIVREIAKERFGNAVTELPPLMAGEDFSAFARRVPSTYVFIGASNAEFSYPHHHPKFGLDEASFEYGLGMMVAVAKNAARFSRKASQKADA